jgi:hypothetical protein
MVPDTILCAVVEATWELHGPSPSFILLSCFVVDSLWETSQIWQKNQKKKNISDG